jgi:AcrR family transcriptional regulator
MSLSRKRIQRASIEQRSWPIGLSGAATLVSNVLVSIPLSRHRGVSIVPSEDRDRLVDALTRVATERGYPNVEIEQIARSAGYAAA